MTVSYTSQVATCGQTGCFWKLLARWRGGIYKLIWWDVAAYLILYFILACVYHLALNKEQQHIFENIKHYCRENSRIPVSFVLGFYLSIIMTRWWKQCVALPRPDASVVLVSGLLHGHDVRSRIMRRTIVRYLCFAFTMSMSRMSPSVKKRFPTLDHFVDAGFLVEKEKNILLRVENLMPRISKHWVPIIWVASIVTRARSEGRIRDDSAVQSILTEINAFHVKLGNIMKFDSSAIPLVYTQVVCLAVYSYFFFNIMDDQWVDVPDEEGYDNWIHKYFPFFTILEFIFFMGWLKVAEVLINPFGEDDEDFEINWLIDRHLKVGYLIVDEMHHDHPELVRDQYWDEVFPAQLRSSSDGPPEPSTAKIGLSKENFSAYAQLTAYISRLSRARATLANIRGTLSETTLRQVGVVKPQPYEHNARNYSQRPMRSVDFAGVIESISSTSSSSSGTLVLVQDIDSMYEFDRLRNKREMERLRRQQAKLLRAIANVTNVNNVASIISIVPERRWADSDFEESSDESANELKVVADAKDKPTTLGQQDAFDRLKEERLKRRLNKQKRLLTRNIDELKDIAYATKIMENKRSAKHDQVAATKRWKKAQRSTSVTSIIKKSESLLSYKYFARFLKPTAYIAAQSATAEAKQKSPSRFVEKTPSTTTLTTEDQAPLASEHSMHAPAQTTEQLMQADTKLFSSFFKLSAEIAAQSSTATAAAQQKLSSSELNAVVEKTVSTATLTPVDQAASTSRPSMLLSNEPSAATINFDLTATSLEDKEAAAQQELSSSELNVVVEKTISTATLTPVDQAASTSRPSMVLSNEPSADTIYYDLSATSFEEKEVDTKGKEGAPAQTAVRAMTEFFSRVFEPPADIAAQSSTAGTQQKLLASELNVEKTASTTTLTPENQAASTSRPSMVLSNEPSAATIYYDLSATSLEEKVEEKVEKGKEDAPTHTTLRMTQEQNILPVPSEESIYYDPSEISLASSKDKIKKADSKSTK